MVLGCYYLTKARPGTKGEGRTFASTEDVLIALEMGEVETLTPNQAALHGQRHRSGACLRQPERTAHRADRVQQAVHGDDGRARDHERPPAAGYAAYNGLLKKKGLGQLVQYCYLKFGLVVTVGMLDEVKNLGFLYATRAGIYVSIGIDDMVVPSEKAGLVREAEEEVGAGGRESVPGRRHHARRAL